MPEQTLEQLLAELSHVHEPDTPDPFWPTKHNEKRKVYLTEEGRRQQIDYNLRRQYGITIEDKEKMYEEQAGMCALCKKPLEGPLERSTCVDHDHASGEVRGLVHPRCNMVIGLVEGQTDLVRRACAYLRF
jgi:hypothetical protein